LVAPSAGLSPNRHGGYLHTAARKPAKARKIGIWRESLTSSDWRRKEVSHLTEASAPVRKCSVSKESPCNAVELQSGMQTSKLMIGQSISPSWQITVSLTTGIWRACGGRRHGARRGDIAPLCYQSDIFTAIVLAQRIGPG